MKKLISYLLAVQLAFSIGFTAQAEPQSEAPVSLPAQFLNWQEFKALKPEVRALYLEYLFYVSAVVQDTQYSDELIRLDPEDSASLDFKYFLRQVFAGNEAHAVVPLLIAGAEVVSVGCTTFAATCIKIAAKVASKMASVYSKFRRARAAEAAIESAPAVKRLTDQSVTATRSASQPQRLEPLAPDRSLVVRPASRSVSERPANGALVKKEPPIEGEFVSRDLVNPQGPAEAAKIRGGWINKAVTAATAVEVGHEAYDYATTGVGTQPAQAAGANLDAKPAGSTPRPGAAPTTSEGAGPKYTRQQGSVCIFGGYAAAYDQDRKGGCRPPKEAVNSAACRGTKKPSFKCNSFGITEGQAAADKKLCVTLTSGQALQGLTQVCLTKYLDILHGKFPSTISRAEYEKLIGQINQQLDASPGNSISIRKYCGSNFSNDGKQGNEGRQKIECETLKGLLVAIEDKVKHQTVAAASQGQTPGTGLRPAETPAAQ